MLLPVNVLFTDVENESTKRADVKLKIARLDLLHKHISGNKIFKLYYFLQQAKDKNLGIKTFGGAYSNHLAATAFACKELQIPSTGMVRGSEPKVLSPTLQFCLAQGMKLEFLERQIYSTESKDCERKDVLHIPEGGFGELGVQGAQHIMSMPGMDKATHIITAIGTATTFAGLINAAVTNQTIVGVPVLKNMQDIEQRLIQLGVAHSTGVYTYWPDYDFGGYAKKTDSLIQFMNDFYTAHSVPLDFVYTAKMMYSVLNKIENGFFKPGSTIIALHTGGLQGNASLPKGTLVF